MEIESRDIVLLIQQYLAEQNLTASLESLQLETGVVLANKASADTLHKIIEGKWAIVLRDLRLEPALMVPLYDHISLELVELGELGAARSLLRQTGVGQYMRDFHSERYLQLEDLASPSAVSVEPAALYGRKGRQARRQELADSLAQHIKTAEPQRLLALLTQALRFQHEHGLIPAGHKVDLFRGIVWKSTEDTIPNREYARIKFGRKGAAASAAFSADGKYFVTGSRDGFIEVYNDETGKLRLDLQYQAQDQIMMMTGTVVALAISNDSEFVCSGSDSGEVMVWKLSTGKCLKSFRIHKESVTCLRFSKDSSQIISASNDAAIKVFGMDSGKCIREFRGHKSFVTDFLLVDSERRLISSSADGTVKVWDFKTSACKQTVTMDSASDDMAILKLIEFRDDIVAVRRDQLFVFNDKLALKKKVPNPFKDEFFDAVKSPNDRFVHAITTTGNIVSFANWEPVEKQSIYTNNDLKQSEVIGFLQHPSMDVWAVFCDDGNLRLMK